jgi:hypothetical protein
MSPRKGFLKGSIEENEQNSLLWQGPMLTEHRYVFCEGKWPRESKTRPLRLFDALARGK